MYLKGLSLKKFRNIEELSLQFHPRFNILVGENAQGKTNILESIYFLAFGRSFRVSDFRNLIPFGETQSWVKAWLSIPLGEEERSAHFNTEKKKIFKNGKPTSPNQFQSMPVVLFAPEEILLLKDSPQARRDYVDGLLSKLSATYGNNLSKYKRALVQRNKILKDEFLDIHQKREQMMLWEGPLSDHGMAIISERKKGMEKLNEILEKHYYVISGKEKKALFCYEANVEEENFMERQASRRDEELERGVSLVGPHRDDFLASLEGGAIRAFGSQGEMRSFTLALKLSEIQLFEEILGQSPILLLDDVLSELDENRSRFFFSYLHDFKGQVFTTATSLNLFPASALENFSGWQMEKGAAKPI